MDFQALFRPGILKTRPYRPGKPIGEVQRELGLDHVVKLASNENPEPPSPAVLEAIAAAARSLNRYPDGGAHDLTHALAERYDVPPASVLLGNGSNEVIDMLIRALVSPGENVVFGWPSFIVYPLTCGVHFECGRPVPLADDDRFDLPAMAEAVDDDTKLLIVCNPNNPTGTYNTTAELRALLASVPERVIVALDEAYCEYVTATDYPDTVPWLAEYPNLVVCRTFSKIHSLAGLRVGFALGHPDLVAELQKTREPFNVNSLAQAAALAVLADPEETRARAERNARRRAMLSAGLSALGLKVVPSQANFLLVRCPGSADALADALLHRGVIVRPMHQFGLGDGAVRVSVGTEAENSACLAALRAVLEEMPA